MSANADKLARNARVHDLHREMKASVSELVGVTHQIRDGLDPAAVGKKILASRTRPNDTQPTSASAFTSFPSSPSTVAPSRDAHVTAPTPRLRATWPSPPSASPPAVSDSSPPASTSARSSSASHLPFSAVSLGRIQSREIGVTGGGDVLADALAEEDVARRAGELMGSEAFEAEFARRASRARAMGDEVVGGEGGAGR